MDPHDSSSYLLPYSAGFSPPDDQIDLYRILKNITNIAEKDEPRVRQNDTVLIELIKAYSYMLNNQKPDLNRLPPITRRPNHLLSFYDHKTVELHRQKFAKIIIRRPAYTILQAGYYAEKRFSDDQVGTIAKKLKDKNPDAFITVITDKEYLKRMHRPRPSTREDSFPWEDKDFSASLSHLRFPYTDQVIPLINRHTLNQSLGVCASDCRIVTTDTGLAWIGSSAKAWLGGKQNGVLPEQSVFVLHTVAQSKWWDITGANVTEAEQLLDSTKCDWHGIMPHTVYLRRGYPSKYPYSSSWGPRGIHEEDFQTFLAEI